MRSPLAPRSRLGLRLLATSTIVSMLATLGASAVLVATTGSADLSAMAPPSSGDAPDDTPAPTDGPSTTETATTAPPMTTEPPTTAPTTTETTAPAPPAPTEVTDDPGDSTTTTTEPNATSTTTGPPIVAQLVEMFNISIGDTVSDGVPAAGAGNIEAGGDEDSYTFSAGDGEVIVDILSGRNTTFKLRLTAPDGSTLFDGLYGDRRLATTAGTYTVTVYGFTPASTGTYSLQLLAVPAAERFAIAIGDTVSEGVPAPGAGNVEVPGAADVYTFDASAGQRLVLDHLTGANTQVRWTLAAPDGSELFNTFIGDRAVTLPAAGTYTLTLSGLDHDDTGTYSFALLPSGATEEFAIAVGDTVSDGVPAPGAGNIEVPGAADVYTFDASAGQRLVLDHLTGANTQVRWTLAAPDGSELFNTFIGDRELTLPAAGTYSLTLSGINPASTGTYSFTLLPGGAIDEFAIAIGDTVSNGVPAPGAGNIETPGAADVYRFDATAGQHLILDELGNSVTFHSTLVGPTGALLIDGLFVDRQVVLPDTGTYVLTIDGLQVANTGTYSFTVLAAIGPPEQFAIAYGDTVADGSPAPGAGNLEGPGAVDVYTFTGTAGEVALLDVLDAGNNVTVLWTLTAPDGTIMFQSNPITDREAEVSADGTYTLSVTGQGASDVGPYSFRLLSAPTPDEFGIAIGDTVSDGVPAVGAGSIEDPGGRDVYSFDAAAGQRITVGRVGASPPTLQWTVRDPDGVLLDTNYSGIDDLELPVTGTYTLQVHSPIVATGTYSFRLFDTRRDEFAIAYGDRIEDGVPGPGAGNLEFDDSVDVYTFDGGAGQFAVFDLMMIDLVERFRVTAPNGTVIVDLTFTGGFDYVDQTELLTQSGTYTITVFGRRSATEGHYEFRLLENTGVDHFDIELGDQVMPGIPGPGAGDLESPASIDQYHFPVTAGTTVSFPTFAGLPTDLRWILQAPDGSIVFSDPFHGREELLDSTGTYTLTVLALERPGIPYHGIYRFGLVEVSTADAFDIAYGDTVSDGVPAPGAGNIETSGDTDVYRFQATAGDVVVFDVLDEGDGGIGFELTAPSGALYFAGGFGDTKRRLDETGTFVLAVNAPTAQTYSFALVLAPPPEHFRIAIGDTVSDGVPAPGAGNLESIGASDVYTFAGTAGQVVAFDALSGDEFDWLLTAPDGSEVRMYRVWRRAAPARPEVFAGSFGDTEVMLPADGDYQLTVHTEPGTATGPYSFSITDATTTTTTTTSTTTLPPDTTTTSLPPDTTTTSTTSTTTTTTVPPDTTTTTEPPGTTTTQPPDTTSTTTTIPDPTDGEMTVAVHSIGRCLRNNGFEVILVVIYGEADVDVAGIDRASVRLGRLPPLALFGHPVAAPLDVDGDGDDDLVVVIDGARNGIPAGSTSITVSASRTDGTLLTGTAAICLRPR